MGKKEIFLEDAVLYDLSDDLDAIERPLSEKSFIIFSWTIALIALVVLGRVLYLSAIRQDFYEARALTNAGQQTVLKAPRGIFFDRYGKALVSNEPSFNITLNVSEALRDRSQLDGLLNAVAAIVPFDVVDARQHIESLDLERQGYYPLARNATLAQVIELKKLDLKAVLIENSYSRKYPDGPMYAHLLGYTSLVSQADLDRDPSLMLNDDIGKSGIESWYDRYIRGENGSIVNFRDAQGNAVEDKAYRTPLTGGNVYTTVDADLQKVFYDSLASRLASLDRTAGAGIAINPQTGEILAMVSLPSFNNNDLKQELFTDKNKPTFNRVVSGLYSPGSTIKPLVGFGALEEGVIDPLTSILSIGYIEIPNPYVPSKPSRFVDWKPQGWVNLYSALARSSNVYFYEVGGGFQKQQGLGIERLRQYWQKFLLDKKTGIDLPGEASGKLPDAQEKEERTGQPWRIGDTYNASIGQGDLMITPLELIRYISAVASKGKLPKPFVVKDIKAPNGTTLLHTDPSFDAIEMKDPVHMDEVELGMLNAVDKDYGTANILHTIPMAIAGKTGSAQILNNTKTNAFFVGYGPVPNPEIAVLVLIEDAREGSLNAVPVAKDVFEWYYEHRIKQQPIKTQPATSTQATAGN